uniref:Uncharacterized protein n=1 Tax=Chenopodium quinoa TaxID=63459 RepID=A0A803N3N3_CHEQI
MMELDSGDESSGEEEDEDEQSDDQEDEDKPDPTALSKRFKDDGLEVSKKKAKQFNPFTTNQVPRDKNTQADALANLGSALRKSSLMTSPLFTYKSHRSTHPRYQTSWQ